MAELQGWPHSNLTIPDKCDQLWQVTELQGWPNSRVVVYQTQGPMMQHSIVIGLYQIIRFINKLALWYIEEGMKLPWSVSWYRSRNCWCHESVSVELVRSWVSRKVAPEWESVAVRLWCSFVEWLHKKKLAARANDASFYVSLHEWCGRSVGLTVSLAG